MEGIFFHTVIGFAALQALIVLFASISSGKLQSSPERVYVIALSIALFSSAMTILLNLTTWLTDPGLAAAFVIVIRRLPTPCFYLLTKKLLAPEPSGREPIGQQALVMFGFATTVFIILTLDLPRNTEVTAVFLSVVVYKIFYIFMFLRLLEEHKRAVESIASSIQREHVCFTLFVIVIIVGTTSAFGYGLYFGHQWIDESNTILYGLLLGGASFFAHRSARFFTIEHRKISDQSELTKVTKSKLSNADLNLIASSLKTSMERDRAYENPELSLSQLAERVGYPAYQVSQALSQVIAMNFFEFVNRYRVDAAAQLLRLQPSQQVIQVAYQVGFNSKSSFNAAFKRYLGRSPTEFRQENQS